MTTEQRPPPPSARVIITRVIWGLSPFSLAVVLNYLRPDLVAPMLDHVFGQVLVPSVVLFVGVSTLVYLFAAFRGGKLRIGLTVAASLLCTLPALFAVLFGPIVFAFMFGNVPGP